MSDDDPTKQYDSQIASLRDATRWIMSAFAALAAAIVAGSSLSGIGALPIGYRLFGAIGASAVALGLIALLIFLAGRVMVFRGIGLDELAIGKEYKKHRDFIEKYFLTYSPIHTVKDIADIYIENRQKADAGDPDADTQDAELQKFVMTCLSMAKMLSVQNAFWWLKVGLMTVPIPLAVALYASVWCANPSKDVGEDISPPRVQPINLTPEGKAKLLAAGSREACLKSPLLLLFVKLKPAGLSDALTVPQDDKCPSLKILLHGDSEIVRIE